ncbi:FAD:protein FMN transferase [Arenimonas fontis]|nr:FAD:protein FMN transferase [Arenimonas fontis]
MRQAASTSESRRSVGLVLLLAVLLAACRPSPEARFERLHVFGTLADIEIRDADPAAAQAALAEASALLQQYEREWHAWEPSDVTRINEAFARGESARAPASVIALVERSRPLVEATGGLFDPGIGDLVEAWGFHTSTFPVHTPPPAEPVLEAWRRSPPSLRSVRVQADRLSSGDPRVRLDFDAIAEGAASEALLDILRRHDIRNALVNLGGDIVALGDGAGRPWKVNLRDPFGGVLGGLELGDGEALFSSGNYHKFRSSPAGSRWPHVLDPRTGYPARGAAAVAVLHPDPVLADAGATALFVAGPAGFADMVRSLGLGCALMVTEDNELLVTAAMSRRLRLFRQPVPLGEPLDLGPDCAAPAVLSPAS